MDFIVIFVVSDFNFDLILVKCRISVKLGFLLREINREIESLKVEVFKIEF